MTRPCSFIRTGLAVFLFCVTIITGPTLLDNKTHLEVIRWKLPESQKAVEVHRPIVKVVEGGESKVQPEDCLATLVGPTFDTELISIQGYSWRRLDRETKVGFLSNQ